jgi:GNAT superfamily N-acetyltransferase
LSDTSLFSALAQRGWTVDGFENVLIREYSAEDRFGTDDDAIQIVDVDDDESRSIWVMTAAVAFAAPLEPPPAQFALARIVAARPGAMLMLAYLDGKPAGTGELYVDDGIAWLSADATLPGFRRRGVQRALQVARLERGREAGCALAVSEAIPGSASQRNMERLGFRLAYTRMDYLAPEGESA